MNLAHAVAEGNLKSAVGQTRCPVAHIVQLIDPLKRIKTGMRDSESQFIMKWP